MLVLAAPTSLPLLSFYLTLVLSSPPCPLLHFSSCLKLCGRSGRNCLLPPVLSDYNGSPDTHFSRGTTQLTSWPDEERYLCPPQSLVIPPLISRIRSCLFSDWRRTISSKFFDTQVPSISTEEFVLSRHARCVLSRLRSNGHSFLLGSISLGLAESRILPAAPVDNSSQDISHLILHCAVTDSLRHSLFGSSLSLCDLWSRSWGVARLLGLHGLPPYPHASEGVG